MDPNEMQKLALGYEDRINRQRDRITKFVQFLTERGLLDEFNQWEDASRVSAASRKPEAGQQLQ